MRTHLIRRWGTVTQDPTEIDLLSALSELEHEDSEHTDCSLNDEFGWSLAAFRNGRVILENVATGEGPWHMVKVSREDVLALWTMLQHGELNAIQQKHWNLGYGT